MREYQVEDLLAAAKEGKLAKNGKARGKGTGEPLFQQVGTGSRVQKKESEGDFFKRNRKGVMETGVVEKGEAGVMELDNTDEGGVDMAGLAKEAFAGGW